MCQVNEVDQTMFITNNENLNINYDSMSLIKLSDALYKSFKKFAKNGYLYGECKNKGHIKSDC